MAFNKTGLGKSLGVVGQPKQDNKPSEVKEAEKTDQKPQQAQPAK